MLGMFICLWRNICFLNISLQGDRKVNLYFCHDYLKGGKSGDHRVYVHRACLPRARKKTVLLLLVSGWDFQGLDTSTLLLLWVDSLGCMASQTHRFNALKQSYYNPDWPQSHSFCWLPSCCLPSYPTDCFNYFWLGVWADCSCWVKWRFQYALLSSSAGHQPFILLCRWRSEVAASNLPSGSKGLEIHSPLSLSW